MAVMRGQLAGDTANLCFLVDSARRDFRNQRHRCDGAFGFSHAADLNTVVVVKPQTERCTAIEISQIRGVKATVVLVGIVAVFPGYSFALEFVRIRRCRTRVPGYCAWLPFCAGAMIP